MADTTPARVIAQAKRRPHAPAYYTRERGVWTGVDWATYSAQVVEVGCALLALGVEKGQILCILGFNRPEWVVCDVAAMGVGGAPAGIYTTSSPSEVAYVVRHTQAPIVVVDSEEQWRKIESMLESLPDLRFVVTMEGVARIDHPKVLTWEDFLAKASEVDEAQFFERLEALEPDGLATLIYTSGTTGPPKGVMLSHRNLAWMAESGVQAYALTQSDSMLSYLPLSHIAEQIFSIHIPAVSGQQVYFATSIADVAANLREVQPTVAFGVPRIWEKFMAGIEAKLSTATGLRAKVAEWAMHVGREVHRRRMAGEQHAGGLSYELARRLFFSKVKDAIGLGRARFGLTGAAPIAREVLEFMSGLDLAIFEIYGQSENTGATSANVLGRYRFGSVGPAVPGTEVRIADDGEILTRGPNVFLGYRGDPEATAATLVDGWLLTGDLGELRDGLLYITGRKKDLLITAGGKNIAPQNIELALKRHPLVGDAVVIGDSRKYLVALLTLNVDFAPEWARTHGAGATDLHANRELRAELERHIGTVNADLARVEQIKKFTVLPRNLSIENGELTPSLKVKRNKVNEHFAAEIEALYTD